MSICHWILVIPAGEDPRRVTVFHTLARQIDAGTGDDTGGYALLSIGT